jgi:hypothetical protein
MSDQERRYVRDDGANVYSQCIDGVTETSNRVRRSSLGGRFVPIAVAFIALSIGVLSVPDAPEAAPKSSATSSGCVAQSRILTVPDAPEAVCLPSG